MHPRHFRYRCYSVSGPVIMYGQADPPGRIFRFTDRLLCHRKFCRPPTYIYTLRCSNTCCSDIVGWTCMPPLWAYTRRSNRSGRLGIPGGTRTTRSASTSRTRRSDRISLSHSCPGTWVCRWSERSGPRADSLRLFDIRPANDSRLCMGLRLSRADRDI